MWLTGPVAPRHVGSSQTRARTRVPCIGRQILNHCATREAPLLRFLIPSSQGWTKLSAFCIECRCLYSCPFQSPPHSKSRFCRSLVPCLSSHLRLFCGKMVQTMYLLTGENSSPRSCCSSKFCFLFFCFLFSKFCFKWSHFLCFPFMLSAKCLFLSSLRSRFTALSFFSFWGLYVCGISEGPCSVEAEFDTWGGGGGKQLPDGSA